MVCGLAPRSVCLGQHNKLKGAFFMKPFDKGFLVGASTAAHQVEGNNVHSDCWALERIPHTAYAEPSGEAVDHYQIGRASCRERV